MLGFLKRLFARRPTGPAELNTGHAEAVAGRRVAEEGLRRAEDDFRKLVAGVRDYAIFLLDEQGRVISWNTGAERLKGYTADDIIGKHFSIFYPPEAVTSGWPAYELREAVATGRFEDEGWRVRKDGSRFWASVVITCLRDDVGLVGGFLKITRDLTARRHAEEKLRLSEERFRLLVEGIKDYALFMLDPEGLVMTWNTGAERLYGYGPEEIIGQSFQRLYAPEAVERGGPAAMLRQATAEGRSADEDWRVRKDGSRYWADVIITAVRGDDGALRGFAKITRDLTERKRAQDDARRLAEEEAARRGAEAAARQAELAQREEHRQREQLRVTLASIGDAVIVTDTLGQVTFLNAVAEGLTGWPAREAVGQPLDRVFRIVNEETRRTVESPVTQALREGIVVGLANHTVLLSRDGREMPIDDSAAPIRGEDGAVAGVVLVFRDVTEARRAVETRLHLAAIVESSDDAIISKNLEGNIVSWNKGAERLYGYTAAEILGKPLALLMPPERPDELPTLMERLWRGERVEHFETTRVRKDGSRVEVSLTISPVRNADGKVIGASKIARDITQNKRNEAALRFLAGASRALAELLDVPSTLQKVAGLAVPHFADWCGVDLLGPDGALERVAVAHVDPAKVELAHELHRRFPPDPKGPRGAWHVLRTGRSELIPEINEALLDEMIVDPERRRAVRQLGIRSYMGVPLIVRGKPIGVLTFVAAESGRLYGPDDLRLAEDLANRAAVAIENSRLYSELKDADRRKDEFLAMLGHELRNPLAPIRTALEVMRTPGVSAQDIEAARQISERQVYHMVRLVDDLLDVSRIMRGRIELRKEPVDLDVVLARAVETAQPMIDARGHNLIVSLPADPVRLEADPTRLTQVVANLLHNAAKFSERAGRIWLTAQRENGEVVIQVRDEGTGIRPELLPHIFDLFVQGDRTLERSQGGLGIGLTVVRRLVELHGGTITARSEGPGKGSELTVRLPGAHAAERPGPTATPGPALPARARRVLVVDDNVDAAESIAVLLRLAGHEVHMAHNGPEALRMAQEQRPEVMVLDIGLPGMSGYEVAQRLRQEPGLRNALLVAVTGYGQEEDRQRSLEAGFDRHLTKPVPPNTLLEIVAAARAPEQTPET